MGEILGLAATHWPLLMQPDETKSWPFLRTLACNPSVPAHLKDPSNWPEQAQKGFGADEGVSAHRMHRERLVKAFRTLRAEIEAFQPDFILMFGDDQYENFQEDIIPPFCVLAYDEFVSSPFKRGYNQGRPNVWGEPAEHVFRIRGKPEVARWLTSSLLEAGYDMSYAYKPLHWEGLGHAFVNIWMYLDYDRTGFAYPLIPIQVNCYGSSVIRNQGGADRDVTLAPDPPSPTPQRCFTLGQAVARILKESPWRTVIFGSGGWSHGFLTEKTDFLWPDIAADRRRLAQIREGRAEELQALTVAEVEDAGQQEFLNWVCVAGAMHELGQQVQVLDYVETYIFNSGKCLAIYKP